VSLKLFTGPWMKKLQQLWNDDAKMRKNLARADFYSYIGYGFKDEEHPRGFIYVDNGRIIDAGEWDGEQLNWDLRADHQHWEKWLNEGFGLVHLGKAVAAGELVFVSGDYRQMVRNVKLSVPFLRHFELMGEIKTDYHV
jgi:hypothetical protein